MSRRKQDIKKLISYSEILDIKIKFESLSDMDAGEYIFYPGSSKRGYIILNKKYKSYSDILFTLLHELGHHIDYVNGGFTPLDLKALDLFASKLYKAPWWAKVRVWKREEAANKYGKELAKFLEIKIPNFLYNYDIIRTRFYLYEALTKDKLSDWTAVLKEIRKEIKKGHDRTKNIYNSKRSYRRSKQRIPRK